MDDERHAGMALIKQGAMVAFDVLETAIDHTVGGDERLVRIELALGEVEDDDADADDPERSDDHEWGALGFMYCLAALSYGDARPRGASGQDFVEADELGVADFHEHLRYERGQLVFGADYIRGRCVKTDITVRPDGTATLETRCRGEAAVHWLDRLRGRRRLAAVS